MATNSPATAVTSIPSGSKPKTSQSQPLANFISNDILDDLGTRFIINVPENERQNLIRVCFQIELAHWFYLDFYCLQQKQKCGIKQFAYQLFQRIPFLLPHLPFVEKILEDWKQYKLSVPTYGAILLSEDLKHVLLVQSFWAKSSWGFPKGKINENEEPVHCAIREVYEETGFQIKDLLVPSEYIEVIINYQYTRLYLIRGVPISTIFFPQTRNEIKCCEWFPIDLLPATKNDNFVKDNLSMNGNSFFMILPFVKRLRKWLEKEQKNKHKGPDNGSNNSPVFASNGKQNSKYFENKSGSAANHSQAGNRQRQRHKSMGEIEQQRSKSIGSQNFLTPEQFSKQSGTNSAHQSMASGTADTQVPSGSASNKKSHGKKHSVAHNEIVVSGASTGGRMQIKRKLFDHLTEDKPKISDSHDPLAMFNECEAWVSFKLDYSKFF